MVKVLIVDDDKLVRKGLISSMPWQAYDMEVVGEASNGKTALEFLQKNEVDLMMVDLAMPVMSGIELMKIVGQRYPKIYSVVLTFHQDFDYVQEALRLGAIDYIAKVQLEKERFDEVLNRISTLIKRAGSKEGLPASEDLFTGLYSSDQGIVLITTDEQPDTQWIQDVDLKVWNPEEIGNRLWLWVPNDRAAYDEVLSILAQAIERGGNWVILRLSGIQGEKRSVVHHILRGYREKVFFYEHDSTDKLISKTLAEIRSYPLITQEEEILFIKDRWLTFKWVSQGRLFEQMLEELKKSRMPVSRLIPLMNIIEHDLTRLCETIKPLQIEPLEKVTNWYEMEKWIRVLYDQTFQAVSRQPYSESVSRSVFEAVKIINDELNRELTALDIAKRVNLSRSYFNQCFKDITGKPFNDYLRQCRIERAKEYLLQTNQPISWVADKTGYLDEKYFSHVFKEQTGMLPSEFRRNTHSR
jgi:two-component system response regulator YesN